MRRFVLIAMLLGVPGIAAAKPLDLGTLSLPPGFHIATYSGEVPNARELALGTQGTVFAGSREAGKIYALTDTNHDGHADMVRVIASGLQLPSGIAFHAGDLYVGAVSRIYVLRDIEHHLDAPPKPELVTDKLPDKTHHGWKFLAFGPDGRLYVPIGAPCNICDPGKDFAKLISMKADGSDWRDVAHGIRNSVGFDWQPRTQQLWFTDNGRDMLGDDLPSDELNRITRAGENFGFPYCHQGDTLDPEFGKGKSCKDYVPPVLNLGAHVASLGMRFYTGEMFPAAYRGAAIIAEHGSWNRSKKSGYRVMTVRLDGDHVLGYEPLIDGFQHDEQAHGRPADVLVMPDGALLVSDDLAGAVYRVTYTQPAAKQKK
ncbi:MAG: PQQ-dependent sugar dehydrogenase [Dokdonella sp.]